MITEDLFEKVLIEPVRRSADTLYIVSGYATGTMVYKHLERLKEFGKGVRIELIVGMTGLDGISKKDHDGFLSLVSGSYRDVFTCRYVAYGPAVHSKTFTWYSENIPKVAFTGSANYTQSAFGASRREAVTEDDAESLRDYFDLIRQDTIDCVDPRVSTLITIHNEPGYSIKMAEESEELEESLAIPSGLAQLPHVNVSFLDRMGGLPRRSGLNWGQRQGRNRNQAYIRLPARIYNTDFFPPRPDQFTIITDDGKMLVCVRAQDNAKAIHTSDSNSRMGLYFRYRLGLEENSFVYKEDLERYGRTDIDFYKIDEETYYMDFSV